MSATGDPFTLEVIRNMPSRIPAGMSRVVLRAARAPLTPMPPLAMASRAMPGWTR